MRGRGDLAPFSSACDDEGATATESVAACICRGLRRQYAIGSLPSRAGLEIGRVTILPVLPNVFPTEAAPFGQATARFRTSGRSLTRKPAVSDQIGDSLSRIRPRPRSTHGNHENVNKSKGPDRCPGLGKWDGIG